MTKYIDAERLRKEVKSLEKTAHKSALGCADSETRKFHEGKDFAYQHVGILIDSLQQEMWKPSKEQMRALNEIVNILAASPFLHQNDYLFNILNGLREELKKLL